jgi:hypothetical protein
MQYACVASRKLAVVEKSAEAPNFRHNFFCMLNAMAIIAKAIIKHH